MACPVRALCLRHAIDVHEPYGIWGGLSASERADLTSKPPREASVETGRKPVKLRKHYVRRLVSTQ